MLPHWLQLESPPPLGLWFVWKICENENFTVRWSEWCNRHRTKLRTSKLSICSTFSRLINFHKKKRRMQVRQQKLPYMCVNVCVWGCICVYLCVRVCVSLWVWEAWDVQVLIIYCMFALHSSACEMGGKMPQGGWKGYVAEGAWHCTGIWRVATAALMRHLHISLAKPALGRPHDKRSQRMQQFCSATLLLMQIKVAKDDWKVHTSASVWDRYSSHVCPCVCFGLGQACIIYSLQLFWPTGLGSPHSGPHCSSSAENMKLPVQY